MFRWVFDMIICETESRTKGLELNSIKMGKHKHMKIGEADREGVKTNVFERNIVCRRVMMIPFQGLTEVLK